MICHNLFEDITIAITQSKEAERQKTGAVVLRAIGSRSLSSRMLLELFEGYPELTKVFPINDSAANTIPALYDSGNGDVDVPEYDCAGYAFELAENAVLALNAGYIGSSRVSHADYALGRSQNGGALAWAVYDPQICGENSIGILPSGKKFLSPQFVLVVSVFCKDDQAFNEALARKAIVSIDRWCKAYNFRAASHLLGSKDPFPDSCNG